MIGTAARATAAAAVALAVCACRGGGTAGAPQPLTYDGATSISSAILDEAIPIFEAKTGQKFVRVDRSGGGKGLARLFAGEVGMAGVARRLSVDELGRKPYFQIIGYDALGVFVHASSPVRGLSKAQLKALFTGTIVNWKDVGGPNLPVRACTEPLASQRNTLAVLQSTILDDAPFGPVREAPDPADCLAYVRDEPGGVTVATVAYSIAGVRPVAVDGVMPSAPHVVDASYLLSRPLLLVTREPPAGPAADFFAFMLSPEGQAIVGKRFIPAR